MVKSYGYISNQLTGALISSLGEVVWLPMPRYDSSPVFAKILDEEYGGELKILPNDEVVKGEMSYDVMNVLTLRLSLRSGKTVKVTYLIPIGESALLAKIESDVEVRVIAKPTFEYGLYRPIVIYHRSALQYLNPVNDDCLALVYTEGKRGEDNSIVMQAGVNYIYLVYYKNFKHGLFSYKAESLRLNVKKAFENTVAYWKEKEKRVDKVNTRFKKLLKSSYGILLGTIYSPTSAPVASPATSLPEIIGGKRNWDYRYAWIRDSSIIAEGLMDAGDVINARRILNFLLGLINFSSKPFLHPLYTIDGGDPPPEKEIRWLSGYKGSKPVRVGNQASEQIQLDVEGFFMSALWKYYEITHDKEFIKEVMPKIEYIANWEAENWRLKDASIWEERGVSRHYTHSKAMMWIAMKRAGDLMKEIGEEDIWEDSRRELRDWIFSNCVSKEGYLTRYAGSEEVDSALLSLPLYGFIDVRDEVFLKTLKKIEGELKSGLFVKRYLSDFMGEAKHPFLLTSLWLGRVYVRLGRADEAIKILEELDRVSGDLGLLGEHYDVENEEFTGNFPQAFVHAQVISLISDISANSSK
ncbi:MAG: glycoside hydrolase family 15 protein [Sulfolobaceae archaeon]|nr:glycoside hydrolase family 15 protein [Sulfolobaceae archaeon]